MEIFADSGHPAGQLTQRPFSLPLTRLSPTAEAEEGQILSEPLLSRDPVRCKRSLLLQGWSWGFSGKNFF